MKKALLTLPFLLICCAIDSNAQSESTAGKVFWRGMVDNKVHLVIKGDALEQRTIEGQDKVAGKYSFTAPLPQRAVTVGFVRKEGRSKKIRIVQQPAADNEFTAIVEIHDDGGGAREYQLEIFWQ